MSGFGNLFGGGSSTPPPTPPPAPTPPPSGEASNLPAIDLSQFMTEQAPEPAVTPEEQAPAEAAPADPAAQVTMNLTAIETPLSLEATPAPDPGDITPLAEVNASVPKDEEPSFSFGKIEIAGSPAALTPSPTEAPPQDIPSPSGDTSPPSDPEPANADLNTPASTPSTSTEWPASTPDDQSTQEAAMPGDPHQGAFPAPEVEQVEKILEQDVQVREAQNEAEELKIAETKKALEERRNQVEAAKQAIERDEAALTAEEKQLEEKVAELNAQKERVVKAIADLSA